MKILYASGPIGKNGKRIGEAMMEGLLRTSIPINDSVEEAISNLRPDVDPKKVEVIKITIESVLNEETAQ